MYHVYPTNKSCVCHFFKKSVLGGREHMGVRQMCENHFHRSFQRYIPITGTERA